MTAADVDESIGRARQYLLDQAEQHFAETCHRMRFPCVAGFRGPEEQAGDVFARAVLAGVLLDLADLDPDHAAVWQSIARREAEYIAAAKSPTRAGGWSYFPNLPELPPDLDSLAAALRLFARIAPELTPLCAGPLALALRGVQADGAMETWLVADTDSREDRTLMDWGIQNCWGRGADVEVIAHFLLALLAHDPTGHADILRRGVRFVLSRQSPAGAWKSTWYSGDAFGTGLCLRLLRALAPSEEAIGRAVACLWQAQRPDGGWGDGQSLPLETALTLDALGRVPLAEHPDRVARAIFFLLDYQARAGFWNASPWIRMDIGRASGSVTRVASYRSTTLTTAFCLRALLLARLAHP